MTETPPPAGSPGPQTQHRPTGPGVDTAHLRSYESLRRSVTDRRIAGVAGGLGRHLNIDPTVLRVLFVVMALFGGAGFVLYGAAWLLVPEEGHDRGKVDVDDSTRNVLLIAAAAVAGLVLLGHSWGGPGAPWPVVLVGFGVLLFLALRGNRRHDRPAGPAGFVAGSGAGVPPEAATPAAWNPEQAAAAADPAWYAAAPPSQDPGTGQLTDPATGQVPPWQPPYQQYQPYQPTPRRSQRKRGPLLFGPTLALVAVALGVLGIVDASGGSVPAPAYAATALTVVGLMLVLGAFVGRAGGLILLGALAAAALAVTSLASVDWNTPDRVERPAQLSQVKGRYFIDHGRLVVDLSKVTDPAKLDGRTIDVGANAGELDIVLPRGVQSEVTAKVDGPGEVTLPDQQHGGIGTDLAGVYGSGPATVTIRADVSVGSIDVRSHR